MWPQGEVRRPPAHAICRRYQRPTGVARYRYGPLSVKQSQLAWDEPPRNELVCTLEHQFPLFPLLTRICSTSQTSLDPSSCQDSSTPFIQSLTPSSSIICPAPSFRTCEFPGCEKRYNGPDASTNLRRHKREKHGLGKSQDCPFPECAFTTMRRHNLKMHWRRRHKGVDIPHCLS